MLPDHSVHIVGFNFVQERELTAFLTSRRLSVHRHKSLEELLVEEDQVGASCVIMDLLLFQSRPDILQTLASHPSLYTSIFLTRAQDISCAVRAMKAGAIEVLEEPLNLSSLSVAVDMALRKNEHLRARRSERVELMKRYERLTSRERQVLPMILGGWLVKQSAFALGVAQITLQIHRTQILKKMEAESIADLVRMGVKLGIRHAEAFRSDIHAVLSPSVTPS